MIARPTTKLPPKRAEQPNAISVTVVHKGGECEIRIGGRRYCTLKNDARAELVARQLRRDKALPSIHAQLAKVRP